MKKLLFISGCLLMAGLVSCDNDKAEKDGGESDTVATTTQITDTTKVPTLDASVARNMIRYFKSDTVNANRSKLFRGGMNMSKLTSILQGATSFNIFAAAYPANYPDSLKRNMPTFVLQVKRSGTSTESSTFYYAIDTDQFCPPPPMCYEAIESADY
jgi:hypothetical protein